MGFSVMLYALGACWQLASVLGQRASGSGQRASGSHGDFLNLEGARPVLDDSIVPRVDLGWPEDEAVRAVKRAADTGGFFYLVNHGIPEEIFHDTVRAAHRF